MRIGNREFDLKKNTYIMGILNVTPDSFSDGGSYDTVEKALKRTGRMIEEGADIIDIGAESTRPGHMAVSEDEELSRLIPVLDAIKREYDIPVSIDTYKAGTAKEALKHNADLINDIWGLKYDEGEMAGVIADSGKPCILMHNKSEAVYEDLIEDILKELKGCADISVKYGIDRDKIILDPGIGFGKTYEDNLKVLNNLYRFNETGYPLLLGCSRKSVIGYALDLPVTERLEGTLVTTVLAAQAGYSFVRVHDVKENKRVLEMLNKVTNTQGKN
jgi:dihydropteroate synthase